MEEVMSKISTIPLVLAVATAISVTAFTPTSVLAGSLSSGANFWQERANWEKKQFNLMRDMLGAGGAAREMHQYNCAKLRALQKGDPRFLRGSTC
jgi:hypothetical protein